MKKLYLLALLSILSIIPAPSHADEKLATKESLIAAWEINIKSLPTTKIFEKQSDGVYKFETTLIPYKGEIKIHNVIVDKDIEIYSDYRLDDEDLIKGVIEAEIVGPKEKCDSFPIGCRALESNNTLYYSDSSNSWLKEKEMIAVIEAKENAEEAQSGSCKIEKKASTDYKGTLSLIGMLAFSIYFIIICIRQNKKQNAYIDRYNKHIDIMEERSIKSFEIMEKSISIQSQQTELLKQILEKK